jgi:Domain of unknown function (DUF4282)
MGNLFCTSCGAALSAQQATCPSCGAVRATATAARSDSNIAGSFFSILFNFEFTSFLTLKFIRFIYAAGLVVVAIFDLILYFRELGSYSSAATGFLALIGTVIVWFLWALFLRVMLEIVAAVFRIAENTSELVRAAHQ